VSTVDELYKQSEQLRREGKFEEAIAKLQELQQQDNAHVLSHLALAVLMGKVNRHADAVRHAEQAVQLEPNDTFNWTALSVTFQRAFEGTQDRQYIYKAEEAKGRAAQIQSQR
jgi:Flp pilus assembly protein TadD